MTKDKTLFEKIGGHDAVEATVDLFYIRVLDDPSISKFFTKIDMDRQRKKQKIFLTYAFGGAPNYSGESMRNSHKKIVEESGLNDSHFDAVAGHLKATLEELDVPAELIAEVMAIAEGARNDVLNR